MRATHLSRGANDRRVGGRTACGRPLAEVAFLRDVPAYGALRYHGRLCRRCLRSRLTWKLALALGWPQSVVQELP